MPIREHTMVLYAYLRRAFPCLSHSPPTVAYAPQSAATYTRAPPGLSNPTTIQSNLHHNYTPYKHNTCNTTTHNKNTANANHTPPQSRTKRNHTADTPHPTTHTTHHVCSIHNNQTRTNQSNHTPYDNIASDSQATQRPSTLNQGGSVPKVHVSR